MKNLAFSFLFISGLSFSQTGTIVISKPKDVVVSADKMNVLYASVDNPVSVAVAGRSLVDIKVKISNGTVTGNLGKYVVNGCVPGKCTFYIYDKTKLIDSVLFRVKKLPSPVVVMGGKRDGETITTAELGMVGGIVVSLDDFDFDVTMKVVGFDLSALNGGTLVMMSSSTNKFTLEQKQLLGKLKSGNKIYIENVKCELPDGSVRRIAGLMLKVY